MGHSAKDPGVNTLSDWISRVRCKKVSCRLQKRRNLLVQAVLSRALCRAETELRQRQQERKRKWDDYRKEIETSCEPKWSDDPVYEEVNREFDRFMSQMTCQVAS